MKIAVIGNLTDVRCGFQNFSVQTIRALQHAGHDVTAYDGTYAQVYARREAGMESFLPLDPLSYDVLHVIWHPATFNHYAGADWEGLKHDRRGRGQRTPVLSLWNGCPTAAWCPFLGQMDVAWDARGLLEGHRPIWYPIPDWIDDLPPTNPAFTVGYSGVRRDGVGPLTEICERHGWQMNFSEPGAWLGLEEEVKRLARSSVNVGWYGGDDDRASSAMMCLASRRPFLCNDVKMFLTIKPFANTGATGNGIVQVEDRVQELEKALEQAWEAHVGFPDGIDPGIPSLPQPQSPVWQALSWSAAVKELEKGWTL